MSKRDALRPARKRHAEALSRFVEWRRLVLNDGAGLRPVGESRATISDRAAYRDLTGTHTELLAGSSLDHNWLLTDRPALEACAKLTADAFVVLLEAGHFPHPPAVDDELRTILLHRRNRAATEAAIRAVES